MLHKSRILLLYLSLYLAMIAILVGYDLTGIDLIYLWPPLIIVVFFWRNRIVRYLSLACFTICFAMVQINILNVPSPSLTGETQEGWVIAEPKSGVYQQSIVVRLDSGTRLLTDLPVYPRYQVGDRLQLRGAVARIEEDDYYEYNPGYFKKNRIGYVGRNLVAAPLVVERRPIFLAGRRWLISVRKKYESILKAILPEPYAGLSVGIMLGSRTGLSKNLEDLFVTLGIIHIIALSGYNITIIADNLRRMSQPLSVRFGYYVAIIGVWSFVLATGLSASAVRAAIMGTLLLLARRLGRQADSLVAIFLAATVMVAVNPYILIYDLGFQLSFTAMLGLVILAPLLRHYFRGMGRLLSEITATTVSAQIFTLPLLMLYFGRVSVISILANLLILPAVPFLMFLIFGISSFGLLSLWLAQKLAIIIWLGLGYVLRVSTTLGTLPGINRSIQIDLLTMFGLYVILLELVVIMKRRTKFAIK